jgi:glyoxylase-like metal-dependent hydrolase (beta-lactamase superfamily II)
MTRDPSTLLPAARVMKLGSAQIFLLSDGQFRLDGGSIFGVVPKVLWEKVLPADELNRVPMALNCLLILSEGKRILVDTGYGHKVSAKQREILGLQRQGGGLLEDLQRLGFGASDIDIVINTHLHPDHCGGNTVHRDGAPVPAFPAAEYWIHYREWEDACSPNERTRKTYLAADFYPLQQAGRLRLVYGNVRVTNEVRCVATRGHTRGHQSVVIESGGEAAVFLGDLAARAVHLERLPWTTAFDTEPMQTLEAKRAMRDWAWEKRAILFFGHDVQAPAGRLHKEGDQFRVERL